MSKIEVKIVGLDKFKSDPEKVYLFLFNTETITKAQATEVNEAIHRKGVNGIGVAVRGEVDKAIKIIEALRKDDTPVDPKEIM